MIKGGLAGKSRAALLDAIGMRKENRKKNSKKKNNLAETGFMAMYHLLWKREDVDEALLSEELAYLDKRRDERDKAIILFRQAQVHHEEKREWYRFVYNHTKTEEEFNEIVQTESLASYKRLMLGLEEDMEDDIHERVTREIVQASNVASDEEDDDCKPTAVTSTALRVYVQFEQAHVSCSEGLTCHLTLPVQLTIRCTPMLTTPRARKSSPRLRTIRPVSPNIACIL
jgi:hypothetical protein